MRRKLFLPVNRPGQHRSAMHPSPAIETVYTDSGDEFFVLIMSCRQCGNTIISAFDDINDTAAQDDLCVCCEYPGDD